jgi:carbamoylphosphate synthase large subunit
MGSTGDSPVAAGDPPGASFRIGRTFKESLQKCLRSLPERGCGNAQPQHVRKHTP